MNCYSKVAPLGLFFILFEFVSKLLEHPVHRHSQARTGSAAEVKEILTSHRRPDFQVRQDPRYRFELIFDLEEATTKCGKRECGGDCPTRGDVKGGKKVRGCG
ncbi:hypothetical protein KM043_014848 [Ampulex compressa]|nr:hypothetical protein KM043_014848 [Ampulex compressa]